MYPVSLDYQKKIKENVRTFQVKIQIQHSQGTLYLSDKDLVQGSLTYIESSQTGEEFTIGGTVASDISFTILNKLEYENIEFIGATVTCDIGLLIETEYDSENYFLQGNYPSEFKTEGSERWEWVPLGRFNIDIADRQRSTIQIKAIDNMINLDKPYSLSKLSYPATLPQIFINACNVCDVPFSVYDIVNMVNKDYIVRERPSNDLTFRDVIGYVAELAGCFAKCNRHGALELKWYTPTDITLDPNNRFNFKPSDDIIQIKGVMATVEDKTYLAGTDDYAIDLTENPLLQGDYETVLPNILANVENTIFTPYTSEWQGNPAIQAGDIIKQIDRDGKEYNTLVTKTVYKYRGKSTLEGRGLPEISRGYKGSTNRKIAEIKRKIDVEIGDKLTTLEEQQLQATELIANMLGGYAIKTDDAFYIADNEDLSKAMKVWKWGIGGFGYSENGVDGPYTTAVTAEGSIVAELVSAGIITADMVQTGILQSEDGSTWINLDDGSFNFKNALVWTDGELSIVSPDLDDFVKKGIPYNAMKISSEKGIQVIDDENKERVQIGGRKEVVGQDIKYIIRDYPVEKVLDDEFAKVEYLVSENTIDITYSESPSIVRQGLYFGAGGNNYSGLIPVTKGEQIIVEFNVMENTLDSPFRVWGEGIQDGEDYDLLNVIIPGQTTGRFRFIRKAKTDYVYFIIHPIVGASEGKKLKIGDFKVLSDKYENKYGILIKDALGKKTILDEDGVLQTWQEGRTDNVARYNPLRLYVYIPDNTRIINKALLRLKLESFRAYSTTTMGGGDFSVTSEAGGSDNVTSSDGGGGYTTTTGGINVEWEYPKTGSPIMNDGRPADVNDHVHQYKRVLAHGHSFELPWHSHEIKILNHYHGVEIPEHSHNIEHGIYEYTRANYVKVRINGTDRTAILGGESGFTEDNDNLDITRYLSIGQWNEIELESSTLGRIDATVFVQALMNVD